jgi:hypothetical protein
VSGAGTSPAGTEGARGHEAGAPVDDRKVPARVFLAIGAFVTVLAVIYWSTAYEESGTVMLLLTAVLGLWIATYLWLHTRSVGGPVADAGAGPGTEVGRPGPGVDEPVPVGTGMTAPEPYLPHASAWPFAIGLGAATIANGLVLGLWVIVPGVALLVLGIGGFVRQTRRRD